MSKQPRPERFHGAFTGGFSAGHYNTVGSAEGWKPSTFSSSRERRAEGKTYTMEDFMDEEDGLLGGRLQARSEFDTLGSTAAELAKRQATAAAAADGGKGGAGGSASGATAASLAASSALVELMTPPGDSVGLRLLRAMGWREGQGVGSRVKRRLRHARDGSIGGAGEGNGDGLDDAVGASIRRSLGEQRARELFGGDGIAVTLARDNEAALVVVPKPKNDLYGIGFEPFRDAPEFAAAAVAAAAAAAGASGAAAAAAGGGAAVRRARSGPVARGTQGFALDEDEDDVYHDESAADTFDSSLDFAAGAFETARAGRLSALEAAAKSFGASADSDDPVARVTHRLCATDGRPPPPGFVVGSQPQAPPKLWAPAPPPQDWTPVHRFSAEEEAEFAQAAAAVAVAVPRGGGGSSGGSLVTAAERRGLALGEAPRAPPPQSPPPPQPGVPLALTARFGGAVKVEAVAAVEGLKFAMASKFTSGSGGGAAATAGAAAAAAALPAAGGLPLAAGLTMPKAATAAAAAVAAGAVPPPPPPRATPSAAGDSAVAALAARKPERTTMPWRPAPLLCKRFNVPVPDESKTGAAWLSGAAASASAAAVRERQTYHREIGQFLPGSAAPAATAGLASPPPQSHGFGMGDMPFAGLAAPEAAAAAAAAAAQARDEEDNAPAEPMPPRPPIDLFKSIFEASESEESEDEEGSEGEQGEEKAAENGGEAIARGGEESLSRAKKADLAGLPAVTPSQGEVILAEISSGRDSSFSGAGVADGAGTPRGNGAMPRPLFVPQARRAAGKAPRQVREQEEDVLSPVYKADTPSEAAEGGTAAVSLKPHALNSLSVSGVKRPASDAADAEDGALSDGSDRSREDGSEARRSWKKEKKRKREKEKKISKRKSSDRERDKDKEREWGGHSRHKSHKRNRKKDR